MKVQLLNVDCMEYMKTLPDKAFDLAIVDPPYGIGEDGASNHSRSKIAKAKEYTPKSWDRSIPEAIYFHELKRVSKHQIIWGWNYFVQHLNECPSYIVWDKLNGENDFADCESAWCSMKGAARVFKFRWAGMLQGNMANKEERIHPTQKPKALYKWLLENYAEKDWKILDTHLGSGSIAVVCEAMGFDFVGCEIDKEYYDNAVARVRKETDLGLFTNGFEKAEGSVGQNTNTLF